MSRRKDAGAPRKKNLGFRDRVSDRWSIRLSVHITGAEEDLKGSRYEGKPRDVTEDDLAEVFSSTKQQWEWLGQMERGSQTTETNESGYCHYQLALRVMGGKTKKSVILNAALSYGIPIEYVEPAHDWEGTVKYVTKEDTRLAGPYTSHCTSGFYEMPKGRGCRSDLQRLRDALIEDGMSVSQILLDPELGLLAASHVDWLDRLSAEFQRSQVSNSTMRDVRVHFLSGKPGVGKTYSVLDRYDRSDVCYITNYDHPMDGYTGQQVLVFDEFKGQIPLQTMNAYLDRYYCDVGKRYRNTISLWTEVWVISNFELDDLYPKATEDERAAFRRRFTEILYMDSDRELMDARDVFSLDEALERKRVVRGRETESSKGEGLRAILRP